MEIKEKKFVSIVIHLKENPQHLVYFLNQLDQIFSNNFETYEYIVVNNSENIDLNTYLTNDEKQRINAVIHIVNLSWVHNLEDAMRAGIDLSIGDFVFEFDSVVLDYDLTLIMDVYKACIHDFDAVAAVSSKANIFTSKMFYKLLTSFSNNINLKTETFRVVSRRMINRASNSKEAFRYRKFNYHYSGLKSKIVIYDPIETKDYKVDFTLSEKFSLASNIMIYYSQIGTHLSMYLSIFFFLISVLVGIYSILSFLVLKENIQEGWTTTMLFLSISFTGVFGILAVLSKYMEVLLKEVQINKAYTYKSIETYKK